MAVDTEKLQEFLGRFVNDLGATLAAGNVVTGYHLGLYRTVAAGPVRAAELAERTGAKVADIGCGLGASTILLAQEYPNSRFTGSDYHD